MPSLQPISTGEDNQAHFSAPVSLDGIHWSDSGCFVTVDDTLVTKGHEIRACSAMTLIMGDPGREVETRVVLYGGSISTGELENSLHLPFPLDAHMPGLPWCIIREPENGIPSNLETKSLMRGIRITPRVPPGPASQSASPSNFRTGCEKCRLSHPLAVDSIERLPSSPQCVGDERRESLFHVGWQ